MSTAQQVEDKMIPAKWQCNKEMEVNSHSEVHSEGHDKVWQTLELFFTVSLHLHKSDLHGIVLMREPLLLLTTLSNHQRCAKEHPNKPDGFWKLVKIELWLQRATAMSEEQRKQYFIKRTSVWMGSIAFQHSLQANLTSVQKKKEEVEKRMASVNG